MRGWAEPDEGEVDVVDNDPADMLRVAFYNVGVHKDQMKESAKHYRTSFQKFCDDVEEAFEECRVHMLCLCELGEHEIGLDDQEGFLTRIVERVNSGASKPAGSLRLVSGEHPTYAVIIRECESLRVREVRLVGGLDCGYYPALVGWQGRAGPWYDRQALVLDVEWQGRSLTVVNVHCPASPKRPYGAQVRMNVFQSLMEDAGATEGGAAEPARWIVGGDLNCGHIWLTEQASKWQPPEYEYSGKNANGQYIQHCWSRRVDPKLSLIHI